MLTSLVVPPLAPSTRTQGSICVIELSQEVKVWTMADLSIDTYLSTRLEILAFSVYTLVIIDVILPTVLCPLHIR